jgi:hypothetical protein
MSMGRVEQKFVLANLPIKGFLDKDILKLCSVWISVTRKGRGLVHNLKWDPYSEKVYPEQKQWLDFEDIERDTELREVYNKLTREKRDRISGGEGTDFIPRSEHEEELQKQRQEARKESRDEFVEAVYNHSGIEVTQTDIADAIGVSQKTVSNIVRE